MWNESFPVPRLELLNKVKGKNAIYCTISDKIDTEVLNAAGPNLTVIGTISVGYDHIDVDACKKRGVRIGYTPDVLTDATAELTIALLLASSRRLFQSNKEVLKNEALWASEGDENCGKGLKNSVVGIVGFGRIGYEVAKRLMPFKPKQILYYNRSEKLEFEKDTKAIRVNFSALLEKSDFIICTIALTAETEKIFNAEAFAQMKSDAVFVNTGRGGLVDQEALYDVLKNNRIYAAGLDVTTPEPLPVNSNLLTLSNCNILPHIGSAEYATRIEMARITAVNILNGLKKKEMIAEL